MPTYRNDSEKTLKATSVDGDKIIVPPGAVIKTYYKLDTDDWTKVSDTPFHNPVLNVNKEIHATVSEETVTIELQEKTNVVEIYNMSEALIDVMVDSAENTPGYQLPSMSILNLTNVYVYATRLVFKFSTATQPGQVIVTEKDESDEY